FWLCCRDTTGRDRRIRSGELLHLTRLVLNARLVERAVEQLAALVACTDLKDGSLAARTREAVVVKKSAACEAPTELSLRPLLAHGAVEDVNRRLNQRNATRRGAEIRVIGLGGKLKVAPHGLLPFVERELAE